MISNAILAFGIVAFTSVGAVGLLVRLSSLLAFQKSTK